MPLGGTHAHEIFHVCASGRGWPLDVSMGWGHILTETRHWRRSQRRQLIEAGVTGCFGARTKSPERKSRRR